MRTRFQLFLLLSLGSNLAFAQTFSPLPGPVFQQEIAFGQASLCYIHFDNPSGDSLTLRWRSVEVNLPEGWDADLCDYGLCYIGIPGQGKMQPVHDTVQAYLKLIVQPGTTPGSAWIWFRVWEDGNPDNFVDVFFSLHTPGTVAAQEAEMPAVRFFPNPVQDFLFLENNQPAAVTARLFDAGGRVVRSQSLAGNAREQIFTGDLPAGNYFLETNGKVKPVVIGQ